MGALSSGTLTLERCLESLSGRRWMPGRGEVETESWIFTGTDFAWMDTAGKINVSIHDWLMARLSVTPLDAEVFVTPMNDGYCYSEDVLSVPQLRKIAPLRLHCRCGEGNGGMRKWLGIWKLFSKAQTCTMCPKKLTRCSAFLWNDNQSTTMIVLTLCRLGGGAQEVQLSAEQKMLLLRMRNKRKGRLGCLPQERSPQVTKIYNTHLPHQALWFGCNKEKSFQEKEKTNATVITQAANSAWVLGTGLGPTPGREGQLRVPQRDPELRNWLWSTKPLPLGHRLIKGWI